MKSLFWMGMAITLLSSCNNNGKEPQPIDPSLQPVSNGIKAPSIINYQILTQYPHDTSAYTQGLEFYNGKLYESTGDYQNSDIRITDYKTGKVLQQHKMGTETIFGEGITFLNGKMYQLTWQNKLVNVYNADNITRPVATFQWPYEGWGITNNGRELIISDGSSNLYFVNPADFKVLNSIAVQSDKGPIENINELEYVDGVIYANIYQTNAIIRIDPASGHVLSVLNMPPNFATEQANRNPRADVLNGIAYDSTKKTFLLTGKRWDMMYEVKMNN